MWVYFLYIFLYLYSSNLSKLIFSDDQHYSNVGLQDITTLYPISTEYPIV